MTAAELPPSFTAAFWALEVAAGLRRSHLVAESVLVDRHGQWWLAMRVGGHRFALMGHSKLEDAARVLFTQVHGHRRQRIA